MKRFRVILPLIAMAFPAAMASAQSDSKAAANAPVSASPEPGFVSIFDGKSLEGWHVSAKSGHSGTSKHTSGGRWVVENGAIVGSQDVPGNGGLVITDEVYGDFEVAIEMNNDFGPDSGLFLRSTEDGKAWQAMIDYHAGGNLMGIYGEGLGGNPHVRNYNFTSKVTEIEDKKTGEPPTALPVKPASWAYFWRAGTWNELRARIEGNPPHITTWINGVKFMEWQEEKVRHQEKGGIALQVHGGGDFTKQFVRYRNIRVKKLEKKTAATPFEKELDISVPAASTESPNAAKDELVINVRRDGTLVWNSKELTEDQLTAQLKEVSRFDRKRAIIIRGDRATSYDKIVRVLNVTHAAGMYHVSFATRTQESK